MPATPLPSGVSIYTIYPTALILQVDSLISGGQVDRAEAKVVYDDFVYMLNCLLYIS